MSGAGLFGVTLAGPTQDFEGLGQASKEGGEEARFLQPCAWVQAGVLDKYVDVQGSAGLGNFRRAPLEMQLGHVTESPQRLSMPRRMPRS